MSLISAVDAAKCMEPPDLIATGQHVVPVILDHTDDKGEYIPATKDAAEVGLAWKMSSPL